MVTDEKIDHEFDRLAVLKQMEKEMPYDRGLYIKDVRYCLMRHAAEMIIQIGKRLLVLQEREGYGNFTKICEEDLEIPHTTAYRFMNAALLDAKYPGIGIRNFSHCGKAYALLEAPEEELKRLEQFGVFAGKDRDEIDTMSVKELRELVRQMKKGVDKQIDREIKKQVEENKALQREIDALRRRHPDDLNTWVAGMRPLIVKAWEDFLVLWSNFVKDDNSQLNDEAQDFMVEFYDRIFADLDSIDETRYEKCGLRYTKRKK